MILVIILVVGLIIFILVTHCKRDDKFSYLKGFYRTQPNVRMEYQDVCEKNLHGHCNLSDGTPGVCVRCGLCAASFFEDPATYAPYLPSPIPLPYSERDCPIYCKNQELLGNKNATECMNECRAMYYPDNY